MKYKSNLVRILTNCRRAIRATNKLVRASMRQQAALAQQQARFYGEGMNTLTPEEAQRKAEDLHRKE